MSDIISKICSMPSDFKINGNKSMIQLLKESGYLGHEDGVIKDEIMKFLINHPAIIENWEEYSQDQRCSTGWCLLHEDSAWIVGYFNIGSSEKEQRFTSGFEACAVFIIKELEQLKKNTS